MAIVENHLFPNKINAGLENAAVSRRHGGGIEERIRAYLLKRSIDGGRET